LTGEDKGEGEILEIFLLKFYLLNEKEKTKTLHSKPPCKIYQSKLKIKGVLKISLKIDYVSIRYSRRVLKGQPLYRGLKQKSQVHSLFLCP